MYANRFYGILGLAAIFAAILFVIGIGMAQAASCSNPTAPAVCLEGTQATWWMDRNAANFDLTVTEEMLGNYEIVSFVPEVPPGTYMFLPDNPSIGGAVKDGPGGTVLATPGVTFTVQTTKELILELYPPFTGESAGVTWRLLQRDGGLDKHPLAGQSYVAWALPRATPTPTTTPTNTPTNTPTSTPTTTPTTTITPTMTSPTPTATATMTPTTTITPTMTSPTPTVTATPTMTIIYLPLIVEPKPPIEYCPAFHQGQQIEIGVGYVDPLNGDLYPPGEAVPGVDVERLDFGREIFINEHGYVTGYGPWRACITEWTPPPTP